MRFACLVASALLATGCVPDVTWLTSDGGAHDGTRDSPGLDGSEEAEADAEGDANPDAGDAGDAKTDAFEPCKGDAGAPNGFKCCGTVVCSCTNPQACMNCAMSTCPWPLVCCNTGGTSTVCKQSDGGC